MHTPEETGICDVDLGTHSDEYWRDANSGLVVCGRHKDQYDANASSTQFHWEKLTT